MNWPYSKKWDHFYLGMAKYVASGSKDPSTKCGAVIVRPNKTVASIGFNGFARGIADTDGRLNNRDLKYELIIHCEENAILNAAERLDGYTLYVWPFMTCHRCAVRVIQAGIKRVVAPICPDDKLARWGDSFEKARSLYREAHVEWSEVRFE